VQRLRDEPGGDINVLGSASLVTQLVEAGAVDEYRLMIEPIILGGGKSIFPRDGQARPLELVSTVMTSTGVHVCTYRPAAT
jgi:dihydrofolate reductase